MNKFLLFIAAASIAGSARAAEQTPDYTRDIAPIFQAYCNGCHNAADREGKLSLESYDDLLKGGKGGVAVVPGRIELSRLILLVDGREEPVMPPDGNEAPKPAEIALLKRWVEAGAKGPAGKAPDPTILVTPSIKLTAPPRDAVSSIAISPTASLAAVGVYRQVRLVALDEQAVVRTLSGIRGPVTDLDFSRDGKLLMTASGEPGVFGEAQLWNVADGKLLRTFTGHRDSLYAVALSPDGKTLATASYDQMIKLWDAATGKETKTLSGHNGAVFDLAFNSAGTILASAGADRTIKLWNVAGGTRLDTFSQPTKEQYAVAFSPDGRTVVAGGADNRIRAWNISPTAKENTNPLAITRFAHEGPVIKLAYSADGKLLVSAGEDRMVRVWDAKTLVEKSALERQPDWVPGLALTADAATLALGRMDGTFAAYDVKTAKVRMPATPEVASVEPRGLERGKPCVVTLSGKHLAGVNQVALQTSAGKPAAATARLVPDRSGSTTAAFEITPEAKLPRGAYQLIATSAAGKSAAVNVYVDDLPQVAEAEPNNFAPRTKPTPLGAGYWGACATPGDIDHYRFEAKQGQTVVCQLEAKAVGSMLNGFLTVLDADGEVAAVNNDFDDQDDPLVAYVVPKDGVYAVRVNDQSMNGSPQHYYRLSIGTFPLVTGAFPSNVSVGRESTVELTGFNLPAGASAKLKPTAAGDLNVPIDAEKFRTVKAIKVRAGLDTELVETEPNDEPGKAAIVAAPAYFNGRIYSRNMANPGRDVDLVRFESRKGQTWLIETEAERRGSPVDTKLEVLAADGKPVPRVVLQAVRDSYITFRSVDSVGDQVRLFNWEEMELNEYLYMSGEVVKLFRKPQGPDSGFGFYLLGGKRRDYFDTSASAHALDEPAYIVEPFPVGAKLVNNGLPVFTLYYANDDDGLRKFGSDSRLTFTAPADGAYLVRVSDVRGFGGDHFNYRLAIREPKPDFNVTLSKNAPAVSAGSGTGLTFAIERLDGFEGEVAIEVTGLPAGYTMPNVTIEAGHDSARAVLNAAPDAKPADAAAWKKATITARGKIAGKDVAKPVAGFSMVTLEAKPKLLVMLEPAELTIAPGQTISAKLKIERNGFTERVAFDVANLPHGVIVDNIGLNGILIPENQTERQIFLSCYDWVPDTDRTFFAETKTARAGGGKTEFEASRPIVLHVRKPAELVQSDAAQLAPPPGSDKK